MLRLKIILLSLIYIPPAFAEQPKAKKPVMVRIGTELQRRNTSVDPAGVAREFAYNGAMVSQPVGWKDLQAKCAQLVPEAIQAVVPWTEKCCAPIPVMITGGKQSYTYAIFVSEDNKKGVLKCKRTEDGRAQIAIIATCFNAKFVDGCP